LNRLAFLFAIVLTVFAVECISVDSCAAGNKPQKSAKDKTPSGPLPSFDQVTKEVKRQLALDPNYQEGDLLTAPKVEKILKKLEKIDWKVADAREIVRLVLPDGDWMAERLATPEGHDFMRHIANLPGGYDRVDRLRNMPRGESDIDDFIDSPGGYTMIEYMTTTKSGRNMGEQLSEAEDGENFNQPTGRIYTERELLKRLKQSYAAEEARRNGKEPPPSPTSSKTKSRTKPKWKPNSKWRPDHTVRPEAPADAEEPMAPPEFEDGVPQQ
jgi:hypothetical protein